MPDEACPGCGCVPGEGITEDCNEPLGCGHWKQYNKGAREVTNPNVYPITAKFEEEVKKLNLKEVGQLVARQMQTHLGEYEHGTAEPEVLFPDRVISALGLTGVTKERTFATDPTQGDMALETMSAMFLDFLMTYWVLGVDEDTKN